MAVRRRGQWYEELRRESMRTLRELGVPVAPVSRALSRAKPRGILAARLAVIEHESARLARSTAALRAALASPTLDAARVQRRLEALERATAIERREGLADAIRVAVDGQAGADLQTSVFEAAFRELPDPMTDAQWNAFFELVELLEERSLARAMRDEARWWWVRAVGRFDVASWRKLLDDLVSQAHGAWVRHDPPDGRRGRVLSSRWVNHAASLERVSMHAAALDLVARAEAQDPRIERVWELVATVRGWPSPPPHIVAFRWLLEAVRAHADRFKRS